MPEYCTPDPLTYEEPIAGDFAHFFSTKTQTRYLKSSFRAALCLVRDGRIGSYTWEIDGLTPCTQESRP